MDKGDEDEWKKMILKINKIMEMINRDGDG